MSADIWKTNMDLCRCCHTEGKFKNLSKTIQYLGETENYVEILKECFDINLEPISGSLYESTYAICEPCTIRLRDAHQFKKQVLECEEKFMELVNTQRLALGGSAKIDVCVKTETPDTVLEGNLHDNDFEDELDWKFVEGDNKPVKKEDSGKKKIKKTKDKHKSVKTKSCKESRPKEKDESQKDEEKKKDTKKLEPYYALEILDDGSRTYTCLTCARRFKSNNCMSQHYKHVHLHLRPKLRSCYHCDIKVPGYARASHLETAHGIPAPTCNACGKKFAYPFQVLRHQKNYHMGERKFGCEHCDMRFPTQTSLKQHMIKHVGNRIYKCEFCTKSFKWKKNLKTHVMMHLDDRRHVCKVCSEAFVQQSSLKYHITKRHPELV